MTKYFRTIIAAMFCFLLAGWFAWAQFDWSSDELTTAVSLPELHPEKGSQDAGMTVDKSSSSVRIPFYVEWRRTRKR